MRLLLRLLLMGLLAIGGLCLLFFAFQRRLLYFPDRATEPAALTRAAQIGLLPWRSVSGALRGWRAEPSGPVRARVLICHGNAGSALDREYYVAAFVRRGVSVTLLEYPGYGSRPGSPSEQSLASATVEAVDAWAAEGSEPLWLVGESLGSGVASRAARLRPNLVRGVLLVTPFARLAEVAQLHYPFLPGFVLRDRWAPADDLAEVKVAVAVVVAGQDEVVTASQGHRLFAGLPGPKRLWVQPAATHNGLDLRADQPWWDEVISFLASPGASSDR